MSDRKGASSGNERKERRSSMSRDDQRGPSSSSSRDPPRRSIRVDADTAKRGNRMFGLLNSTLTKAKEENEKHKKGEAARKRAEIEARLQNKLQNENDRQRQLGRLETKLRPLIREIYEIAIEIESKESAIQLRKAQKRRLASFLITTSELSKYDGKIAKEISIDGKVLAPDVTLALGPIGPTHPQSLMRPDSHPIYFLPKKNLNTQDDRLDEQEDRVDDEIDQADQDWRREKGSLEEKMHALKGKILEIKSEMAAIEAGEERSEKHKNGQADTEMHEAKGAENEEHSVTEVNEDSR